MKKLTIGILTNAKNTKLVNTIEAHGHEAKIFNPEKMYMYISEYERGYDRLYFGIDGDAPERITAKSIDIIINRVGKNTEFATDVLKFMVENLGIYCPNKPDSLLKASNKAKTLQILSSAKIPVPRTIVCQKPAHVKWLVETIGELPIVIKKTTGSQGDTVGIVDTKVSANSMCEFIYNSGINAVVEEYIEAESKDYRVWVVGDKTPVAMRRTAKKGDWKSNISKGGTGERVYLNEADKEICIKAAHSLGLNICGVDMLKSKKTGRSVIIEINSNPGTRIIDICNYNVWNDVIKFCEDNYKKGNQKNEIEKNPVENLSTSKEPDIEKNKADGEVDWETINNLPHNIECDKWC